jgi:hypothetical protein
MNINHAWYSHRAATLYGSAIYARADGTEVEVTGVFKDVNSNYGWPDKEYCGEVVKFLRPCRQGTKPLTFVKENIIISPQ